MHEAAYAALGLEGWRYQKLPVPPDVFAETVRALPGAGFAGASVTIPHKASAAALADELTAAAREIGAASSLTFTDGRILADNTDAPGFIAALSDALPGASPATAHSSALVLGAGGGARAIVWALRQAGADVMVWNRTASRAQALCADLGARTVAGAEPADILVNATAVGLGGRGDTFAQLPLAPEDLAGYRCVADLVYGEGDTELIAAARRQGAVVVDGLEVLVRQGAVSFEAWTGRAAPLDVMRAAVRGN